MLSKVATAVEQWEDIVGAQNVMTDPAVLVQYARDESFVNGREPLCVLRPESGDQVARVVQRARRTATPLVPVSSGPPHYRGDTLPSVDGAVIVDLLGLCKVIRIDRNDRVAMFEPGVTFPELSKAVAKQGLRLNMPFAPRPTKSVVASLLEREPVTMPKYQWDGGDPLTCIEVVFGTGDVFRTGSAAGPGSIEEQWEAGGRQKEASGPSAASWYRLVQGAQGTAGIVTWATTRCELLPQLEASFVVGSSKLEELAHFVHWVVRRRLVNECFVLNRCSVSRFAEARGLGAVGVLPEWLLFVTVAAYEYFPQMRMEGLVQDLMDIAAESSVTPADAAGGLSAADVIAASRESSADSDWRSHGGSSRDLSFLTTYDKLPGLVGTAKAMAARKRFPLADIGVYVQPVARSHSSTSQRR